MKRLPNDPSELYKRSSEIQGAGDMHRTLKELAERARQANAGNTAPQRRKK